LTFDFAHTYDPSGCGEEVTVKHDVLLTPAEAGRLCQPPLTPGGVLAAVRSGRLQVAMRTGGGMRLFERSEVERFQAERAAKAAGGPQAA
jgi:hypothetical protein